jgi:hypothetical protein
MAENRSSMGNSRLGFMFWITFIRGVLVFALASRIQGSAGGHDDIY